MTNPAHWEYSSRRVLQQLIEQRFRAIEKRIIQNKRKMNNDDITAEFNEAFAEIEKILSIFKVNKVKQHWEIHFRGNRYINPDKIIDP